MKLRPSLFSLALTIIGSASLSNAHAETFILKDGDRIEGTILRAAGNTISIKMPGRGMQQFPLNKIDQIETVLSSGERIVGTLVDWAGKTYKIQVDQHLLSVRDGDIIQTAAADPEPPVEAAFDQRAPEETAPEESAAEDVIAEDVAGAATAGELSDGVGGPRITLRELGNAEQAIAARGASVPDAATERLLPSITAATLPTVESAGEIAFQLTLSEPAEGPVAVIYSAVDGSATNGADYEQQAGVLTIKPGATSAEVRIPLIDDQEPEADEQFDLFLSVDPKAVSTVSRHITATIQDDDS